MTERSKSKVSRRTIDEDDDRFVEIDQDALDEECVKQPKLYFKWAKKLADARMAHEEAEANHKLVEAELDDKIREDPESYGLEKITEAAIKATIPKQVEFTESQQKVYHARHKVNILQAGVTALEHKKRSIENLVQLHGQNYFSTPRTGNEEMQNAGRRMPRNKREDD